MNLALLNPFELHNELPEVIEDRIVVEGGLACVCAFNRRGNLLGCGCKDGLVVVCDFDTHGVARQMRGHTARVTSVSWTRSSCRLLSSSLDGQLIQWNVLKGTPIVTINLGGEVALSAMHPRLNRACLVSMAVPTGSACKVYLQTWEPEEKLALLPGEPAAEAEASAAGNSSGPKKGDSALTGAAACFDKDGERILIGTHKGMVYVVSGGAMIKSIMLSNDGKSFALNSSDRIIRAYPLDRIVAGERPTPRELQDVVTRTQWSHACFSATSEHVLGAANQATEHSIYIWDLHGHLAQMLHGPKDGAVHFACHPFRPILACCARSGVVYVWTKQYSENWSAFAPDFKELEENEEYEEREDEFDILPQEEVKPEVECDEFIDVVSLERTELAHYPDAEDGDEELLFLPVVLEPDDMMDDEGEGSLAGTVDSAMTADEKANKGQGRKRMRSSSDGRR